MTSGNSYTVSPTATTTYTLSASGNGLVSKTTTITVLPAPIVFTTHPQSRSAVEGDSTTFSFVATGSNPRTYQWQKDSVDIPGATSADYTMTTTLADNGKKFRVVVTNARGSYPSNEATLTVTERPVVPTFTVNLPATLTLNQGQSHTFTVTANGTAPMTAEWHKGSSVWPAMNFAQMNQMSVETSTFTKAYTADLADNGSDVWVVVTNTAGNATSQKCRLTIIPAYSLTVTLTDVTGTPTAGTYNYAPGVTIPYAFTSELGIVETKLNGTVIPNSGSFTMPGSASTLVSNVSDYKPTVGFSGLTDGQVVSGTINFSIVGNDDKGVSRLEYYRDGVLKDSSSTRNPLNETLVTTGISNGTHILKAIVYDNATPTPQTKEVSITVTVQN